MSQYMKAKEVPPGAMVVSPRCGAWAKVHEVQEIDGALWFLWGDPHPPGELGFRFDDPDEEVCVDLAEGSGEDAWEIE